MRLIILPVVAIFIAIGCDALPRLPNVGYLGMGYNIVKGNPDNQFKDPGFRFPVLNITTYQENSLTSDGKYSIPDHVQAMQLSSCGFQRKVSTVTGSQSYQDSVSVDVEAEGRFQLWGARFSASRAYKEVSEGTSQYHRVYTIVREKCTEYEVAVNDMQMSIGLLDTDFYDIFVHLGNDDDAYKRFIDTYGTHMVSRVALGAKMVIRSEFEREAWNRMRESGVKAEIAAQLSFARLATNETSAETAWESQQREAFESERNSYVVSYRGIHLPSGGKWETWANAARESLSPISYTLVPLIKLLADSYIENHTKITPALESYCDGSPGCEFPGPDPVVSGMIKTTSNFDSSPSKLTCPPQYRLLSCGLNNTGYSSCDVRYAIPVSNTTCECGKKELGQCIAWCTIAEMNFTIAKSPEFNGSTKVSCPTEYKVL